MCNHYPSRTLLVAGVVLVLTAILPAASRQYAPDRQADILHLRIDVTPDFKARTVTGLTDIRFRPLASAQDQIVLDACDLDVNEVWSEPPARAWSADDEKIVITFASPIPVSEEAIVHVRYRAEPRQGLYFRTPEMGYAPENTHLFTQGEAHEARHWYPCYDYPNERFTTEVLCRVPADMTVISNGRLLAEEIDPETGLKVSHWYQDKPHVNYLVALCAGYFVRITDVYRDIPMAFYVPTTYREWAAGSYAGTKDMMAYFEEEIGVPYPWDKYDQVVVEDFVAGGMENTTLTILTHRTLFSLQDGRLRSSMPLVAHELVHQWFGDYVTCKDWTNLWLNEGFATYYENLYARHRHGNEQFLYNMYQDAQRIIRQNNQPPIFHRTFSSPNRQFDYRAYQKGGWVLHMLRSQLGETMFRRCVQTFLERHALGVVETSDLRSIVEELSGGSWDRFFDQWVFYAGYPKLTLRYEWSEKTKLAILSVSQKPSQDKDTIPFHLPATIRFICEGAVHDRSVQIDRDKQDFYFKLPSEPQIVRFDPAFTILGTVGFKKPKAMLYAQLEQQDDIIGQIRALRALEKHDDQKTIHRLRQQLNEASFYGTRITAADVLQKIHTDEAYTALTESCGQSDERVREKVLSCLANFYREETLKRLLVQVAGEENPVIRSALIRNVGRYHDEQVNQLLKKSLTEDSFQNRIAQAAVSALWKRETADETFVQPLMHALTQRRLQFTTGGLANGLETLGRLAHLAEDKDLVRNYLLTFLDDPRIHVQRGAIRALGELRDRQSIPILDTFKQSKAMGRRQRLVQAAEEALQKIRRDTPLTPEEVVQLRQRVTELTKDNEKLMDRLDNLEKRLDAMGESQDDTPAGKPSEESKAGD